MEKIIAFVQAKKVLIIAISAAIGGGYIIKKTMADPYGLPSVKIEEEPAIDPKLPAQERMAKIAERNTQNLTKTIERIEGSKKFKENDEELAILHDYLNSILEENKRLNKTTEKTKKLLSDPILSKEGRENFSELIREVLIKSRRDIMLSDKILNKDLFKMEEKEKLDFLEKKLESIKNSHEEMSEIKSHFSNIISMKKFGERMKKL